MMERDVAVQGKYSVIVEQGDMLTVEAYWKPRPAFSFYRDLIQLAKEHNIGHIISLYGPTKELLETKIFDQWA